MIEIEMPELDSEGKFDEEAVALLLEEVARLIREGFTSGYYPTWSITSNDKTA